MKHILILGAGFGGVHAYRTLYGALRSRDDIRVTLINKTDYFWFVPMAHEVATGGLSLESVKYSLRALPQDGRFDFREGNVENIDLDSKKVRFTPSSGDKEIEISYDYLISSLGSVTNFYEVEGAKEYTFPVKSLNDIRRIKNTILHRFEYTQTFDTDAEKRNMLRFVIVGGGPTGVEMAGELADLVGDELADAFPRLKQFSSVVLLQRGESLLPEEGDWFSKRAQKVLESKEVELHFNCAVTKVEKDAVWSNDSSFKTESVFWTAGVKAVDIPTQAQDELVRHPRHGRVCVDEYLKTPQYSEAFFVGDQAWIENKETGQPYPMRAQFAVRQGRVAAQNIVSSLKGEKMLEFNWNDMGFLLSLGEGEALARVFSFRFSGVIAWWLYRTAYIPQILGLRSKLRVLTEWTLNLFTPRDLTEI